MKTTTSAPAHDGSPSAPATTQPTYDSGARYDTGLRYAVGDTILPVDDGAKIKLSLATRPDDSLAPFCDTIIAAMTGNPNFPTPAPTALVFDAAVADFTAKLQAQRTAKAAALLATTEKDDARVVLESLLNMRASYVQAASNGNAAIIQSAAMPLRPLPSPIGVLAPPLNLRVDLNGTPGVMLVMWDQVPKAKTYVVQCADAATEVRVWSTIKTTADRRLRLEDMVVGRLYAFRVAAIGGETGQSLWSTEALRMAA